MDKNILGSNVGLFFSPPSSADMLETHLPEDARSSAGLLFIEYERARYEKQHLCPQIIHELCLRSNLCLPRAH